jgi:hypothetical protein
MKLVCTRGHLPIRRLNNFSAVTHIAQSSAHGAIPFGRVDRDTKK